MTAAATKQSTEAKLPAFAPKWRDPKKDQPFDLDTEARTKHGPFMVRVAGIAHRAAWGPYATSSGGRAWGWLCPGLPPLRFEQIEAWRPLTKDEQA